MDDRPEDKDRIWHPHSIAMNEYITRRGACAPLTVFPLPSVGLLSVPFEIRLRHRVAEGLRIPEFLASCQKQGFQDVALPYDHERTVRTLRYQADGRGSNCVA